MRLEPAAALSCTFLVALALGWSPPAAAEVEVLVGSHLPLTGNLAQVGKAMGEGIAIGTELFNHQQAGRIRIRVLTVDDESSPAKAAAAVEKLASQRVVALNGGYGSNVVGAASEISHRLGLTYMTSGGVAADLARRGYRDFFRINNEEGYSLALTGLLAEAGIQSAALLYKNTEGPVGLAEALKQQLPKRGVRVVSQAFDAAISDYKPLLVRVRAEGPFDALVMLAHENEYVGILRAAKIVRPDVKMIAGPWGLAIAKLNKQFNDLVQNVCGTSTISYPAEFNSAEGKAFAEAFHGRYQAYPDYPAVFGYVQSMLLYGAIARAVETKQPIKEALPGILHATEVADSLVGPVRFDGGGDNVLFVHRIGQHQGDRVVLVWPKEKATGKLNYPARFP